MSATWPGSRTTYFGMDGRPAVGYQLHFYNEGTTTPQVVYADADLATPLDQPVLSDARGMFPAIYLNAVPGSYRQRMLDADGALIFDDDGISVPQAANYVPPDTGDTSEELLFRTGMVQPWYGTSAPSGWVRCNGRTIGAASSGASERANADTEDLFEHLWASDASLAVSGGRGGTASGDFAANKTIALPDFRDRALAGLATMGNADAGLVDDQWITAGSNSSTLGAKAGVDDVTLSVAQIPEHNHPATFSGDPVPDHAHVIGQNTTDNSGGGVAVEAGTRDRSMTTDAAGGHTPAGTITVQNTGGGGAHNNMQPTMFLTILIKL